jgi:hypothetical protein
LRGRFTDELLPLNPVESDCGDGNTNTEPGAVATGFKPPQMTNEFG